LILFDRQDVLLTTWSDGRKRGGRPNKTRCGSDHAGFELKRELAAYLGQLAHEVVDVGASSEVPVDYPDYVE
jgi:Ribose/Galactose Isomerase